MDFKRHIKSFVKREGRLTAGQQRALDVLWPTYGIDINDGALNFEQLFQRSAPTVLEIGFGNGASLAQMAHDHPDYNFVGIEVHRPGVGHLLQLLEKQDSENVRVICDDAVQIISHHIADNSLDQVSIFFPDPWPKKRHHKRRLIQTDFVNLLSTKLKANSHLHAATDWQDYADHIEMILSPMAYFVPVNINSTLPRPDTKYEQRGLRKGHAVTDLVFRLEKA